MESLATAFVFTKEHMITHANVKVFLQGNSCCVIFFLNNIFKKLKLLLCIFFQRVRIRRLLHQEYLVSV